MASSILRWISRKSAANSPNSLRGVINGGCGGRGAAPRMTSVVSNGTFKSRISTPWLMLPPAFEGKGDDDDNMVYKFYSLAENKVLNLTRRNNKCVGDHEDIEFVSSSHGWLTLFNTRNCDLFLRNPLSGRRIKLPPIHTLHIPEENLRGGYGCVTKVITSCSPEEENCLVMMSFGTEDRLAFCSPSSSAAEWTPIGDLYHVDDEDNDNLTARVYQDFVYSSRQKLFYCITQWEVLEAWDLQDMGSPKVIPMDYPVDEENYPSEEEIELKFLVVAEESGDLFLVRRHIIPHMAPDGSYVDYCLDKNAAENLPYKTTGFDVYKYDPEKCAFRYMDSSLDGLALFIGNNHSFAVSAASDEFSELKPNSIYFTEGHDLTPPKWICVPYGGHDLGSSEHPQMSAGLKIKCPECDGAGFVRKSVSTLRTNAARNDERQIVCALCNGLGKFNQIDK
ncbi:hypothetical protein BUALT_Bualt09G0114600 [Buddleja alternifolia]|uniref:KIB1-4 beta-propeller domain-containing protein n=1 Tax=Buddleja alternifolia TaxID=168488 RepID=A0AAV6X365_9LAMI|nr:hypothetical protein BUALT_Bualt09G0114600 [Buddleja alternifolia]